MTERESARWVWLAGGGRYGDDSARDGGMVVAVKRTEVAIENLTGLLGGVTRNGNDRGNANGNGNGNVSGSGSGSWNGNGNIYQPMSYPYSTGFRYRQTLLILQNIEHILSGSRSTAPFMNTMGLLGAVADKIAKMLAEQSQPGVTNPQSESQAVPNSEVVALKEVVADQAKLIADYAKKFETMMLFMATKNGVDPATIPGLISSKENGEDTSIGQEDGIST
ncbi:hypothetical protein RHGRI_016953 [Rhododendron griersonianum]|uniref:Uncharacterized protein n=1 Tax=Rhododendron griersonianum TaxID=479676 RepID=A0AAV6JVZ8_9ERIC|nr:hypothetical protein RHGRI_016953 [Rhododendron griersonianum]